MDCLFSALITQIALAIYHQICKVQHATCMFVQQPTLKSHACCCRLFKMPIALAFSGGFIMSAISPTVLVTGMLELQRRRYGEDKSEMPPPPPCAAHQPCAAVCSSSLSCEHYPCISGLACAGSHLQVKS